MEPKCNYCDIYDKLRCRTEEESIKCKEQQEKIQLFESLIKTLRLKNYSTDQIKKLILWAKLEEKPDKTDVALFDHDESGPPSLKTIRKSFKNGQ